MKRVTAILVCTMLLCITIMTGCSSQSSSATTPTQTVTATPTKTTISATASVDTTLTEITQYDQSSFGIVIPKGAKFYKSQTLYSWIVQSSNYVVQVQITTSPSATIKTANYSGDQTALNAIKSTMESASNNTTKMDVGFKSLTIDGNTAISFSGKTNTNTTTGGTIDVYYADCNDGMLTITIRKTPNQTDAATKTAMDKVATDIFNSIIIK